MNGIGSGVIHGGWGYVWVVYGVTWAVFAFYTASVFLRARGGDR